MELLLRNTIKKDLDLFFQYQLDEEANYMAAFTSPDPYDKEKFYDKWEAIIKNKYIDYLSILFNNQIVGSIASFEMFGERNVSYWIDKKYWGKGIATKALTLFLNKYKSRPLFGRVAFDNYGSQQVLIKNGFIPFKEEMAYANARKKEILEIVYRLDQ
jgi:RimJ/RimL family protein N-acetyltransferase